MVDPFASDEIPEADRVEQTIAVDDEPARTPDTGDAQSWSADEADRIEQFIEVPDDDDHDYDG